MPFRPLSEVGPHFETARDRRNFWLGVANGALYGAAESFTEPYVVLTYFASLLTNSKFLIGLVAPIQIGGWFLPQLLISSYIERNERQLPIYTLLGWLRVTVAALMVAVLWLVHDRSALLVLFLVVLTANRLAEGLAGPSFLDVVGKVIPPDRRGAFFGARRLTAGLLGLGASAVVGWVLSAGAQWTFPHQFAVLFALFTLFCAGTVYVFTRVDEPPGVVPARSATLSAHMRRVWQLAVQNGAFRRFLIARILMVISDMALPFYVVYARQQLHAPDEMVGVYLIILTLAALLANLWAGRASDRSGNRHLLLAACIIGLIAPALALVLGGWQASPVLFAVIFALNGVYNTAAWLAYFNYVLDVAPPDDRPLYTGTANTLVGVAILASASGGALVDWLGFNVLFGLSFAMMGVAAMLMFSVPEPRVTDHADSDR